MREVELTLYSKPECPLCDEMEEELSNASRGLPVRVTKVDITANPELEKKFALEIPLLTHGADRLARHRADGRTLAAKIRKIASGGPG